MTEARKSAVADAMAKARTLSEAARVGLGKIVEIRKCPTRAAHADHREGIRRRGRGGAIEAGENSYRVQVNVTFELK